MKKPTVTKIIIKCPECRIFPMHKKGRVLVCSCGNEFPVALMDDLNLKEELKKASGGVKC